ncbi:MAG: copper homeostasis protein CutC [Sphingomonadales bacterium]
MPAIAEICAFSAEAAIMALSAGAPRIELCDAPEKDGISPPESWFQIIPAQNHAELAVMVRPRGGSFCMSDSEVEIMEQEIIRLRTQKQAGAVVFGLLTPENEIDVPACKKLIKAAADLPCVFHRAFDIVPHPEKSLQILINLGFQRLLCGLPLTNLIKLKEIANGRITIMPGGGVRSHNVKSFLDAGFTEIHSSARAGGLLPDPNELKHIIAACKGSSSF